MAESLAETGILEQSGPLDERSRAVAETIWKHRDELDQMAAQAAILVQREGAEAYEWCRLVALLIEWRFKRFKPVKDEVGDL